VPISLLLPLPTPTTADSHLTTFTTTSDSPPPKPTAFSELRYELNGVEKQKLKYPGDSSCLKGYCSHTPNDLNELQNGAWDMTEENNKDFMTDYKFSGCIPLKHLFELDISSD
jgi:hypothetical protein